MITFGCDFDADGTFNESNDGIAIAANYLNWHDIAAYLDWSALRPLTELEFVKASRGPTSVVTGEYIWGSNSGAVAPWTGVTNGGEENEVATNASANINIQNAFAGPNRCGMFARSSTNRTSAGAGYYGAMGLGGGLWEIVIPLGTSIGRAYTGTHGDGTISSTGYADVINWPSTTGTAVLGKRGGPYVGTYDEAQIANRNYSIRYYYVGQRREFDGCRGCRTAP